MALKKQTVTTLQKMKTDGDKIAMLTCYDFTTARLIEQSAIDAVLVGDSLGMTMMGYEDTLPVTMEDMIHHSACVSRGLKNTFLVADMPFMSYHISDQQAVENAGRLIKEGHANAVKLEGGAKYCSRIRAIVDAQIPVVAHIGLTPQSVNAFGGFKVQGRNVSRARELIDDAKKIEQAGAFMLTLECVPEKLASLITEEIAVPTIGIGAGAGCDGQILVYQDMLDMYDGLAPKFVKHFAHIGREMKDAFNEYSDQVKKRSFPVTGEHTFKISDEVMEELKK
ncbi:MAG: 3-methyl-2-oxobutanoate hydroxymethyltransferase [Lachnospiraceae bacterium]|nr:3-methyl-2-oxobutanoate hydroxymethyltransferase [Lachnospiraceae bacterium]